MDALNTMRHGTILEGPTSEPTGSARLLPNTIPVMASLISIARRRKWVLIGSVLAALLLGLAATLLMTPLYTASTTLEIQRETGNIAGVQGSEEQSRLASVDQEFYQTQYGLLESRSLAERVATDLRLPYDPNFFALPDAGRPDERFQDGRRLSDATPSHAPAREAGQMRTPKPI